MNPNNYFSYTNRPPLNFAAGQQQQTSQPLYNNPPTSQLYNAPAPQYGRPPPGGGPTLLGPSPAVTGQPPSYVGSSVSNVPSYSGPVHDDIPAPTAMEYGRDYRTALQDFGSRDPRFQRDGLLREPFPISLTDNQQTVGNLYSDPQTRIADNRAENSGFFSEALNRVGHQQQPQPYETTINRPTDQGLGNFSGAGSRMVEQRTESPAQLADSTRQKVGQILQILKAKQKPGDSTLDLLEPLIQAHEGKIEKDSNLDTLLNALTSYIEKNVDSDSQPAPENQLQQQNIDFMATDDELRFRSNQQTSTLSEIPKSMENTLWRSSNEAPIAQNVPFMTENSNFNMRNDSERNLEFEKYEEIRQQRFLELEQKFRMQEAMASKSEDSKKALIEQLNNAETNEKEIDRQIEVVNEQLSSLKKQHGIMCRKAQRKNCLEGDDLTELEKNCRQQSELEAKIGSITNEKKRLTMETSNLRSKLKRMGVDVQPRKNSSTENSTPKQEEVILIPDERQPQEQEPLKPKSPDMAELLKEVAKRAESALTASQAPVAPAVSTKQAQSAPKTEKSVSVASRKPETVESSKRTSSSNKGNVAKRRRSRSSSYSSRSSTERRSRKKSSRKNEKSRSKRKKREKPTRHRGNRTQDESDSSSSSSSSDYEEITKVETPSTKPDQAATNAEDKFLFYDAGSHWCKTCNVTCTTLYEMFDHVHSSKHKSAFTSRPWMETVPRRAANPGLQTKLLAIKGIEFLVGCQGFYCSLCAEFAGDAFCAEEHFKSTRHYEKYTEFVAKNPLYEKCFELEKSAHSVQPGSVVVDSAPFQMASKTAAMVAPVRSNYVAPSQTMPNVPSLSGKVQPFKLKSKDEKTTQDAAGPVFENSRIILDMSAKLDSPPDITTAPMTTAAKSFALSKDTKIFGSLRGAQNPPTDPPQQQNVYGPKLESSGEKRAQQSGSKRSERSRISQSSDSDDDDNRRSKPKAYGGSSSKVVYSNSKRGGMPPLSVQRGRGGSTFASTWYPPGKR